MKSHLSSSSSIYFFFFFLCTSSVANAQWAPSTNSTSTPIHRDGSVGVGLSYSPSAVLHVFQDVGPSTGGQVPPTFRLERRSAPTGDPTIYGWDFIPNSGLQILKRTGTTSTLALNIKNYGLEVTGSKLHLGHGGSSSDDLTLGHSNSLNGNYIAFNGTSGYEPFQGPSGKAVIHSNIDGSLYFVTQSQGGMIPVGQNRRLTIAPDGTSTFGDNEPRQTLTISSGGQSILRFNRVGTTNGDFELLGNASGHLEFRGGIDGEGPNLPTLMNLKPTGKLAIGTTDTPDWVGGVNISNYKLYVEGGILTKEIRVRTIWSDYVFEKDYHLLPLEEVELHIKENGHLHNTPSGKSIEENGLELGSMMANQQEKIEEVYLHLIEMNKKLANLEKENEALKEEVKELKK